MTNFKPTFYCQNCGKQNEWKGYSYSNKYCNNKCQAADRTKQKTESWLRTGQLTSASANSTVPDWIKGETGYIAKTVGYYCAICGIANWQGKNLVLEVDCIDGNKTNIAESNLRLLCPNCKSQQQKDKSWPNF